MAVFLLQFGHDAFSTSDLAASGFNVVVTWIYIYIYIDNHQSEHTTSLSHDRPSKPKITAPTLESKADPRGSS